jgi:hypothetical protein
MLYELAQYFSADLKFRTFNVFTYITLRVVLAALTALAISFIVGPAMIRKLTAYKIGQAVRDDGPQTHLIKKGTPHHGRRADPGVGRDHDPPLGRPAEPLRVDRAHHDARLRHRGLGGRLAQGRAPQPEGPLGEGEVLLAIRDRHRGDLRPRVQREASRSRPSSSCPFFKTVAIPLGTVGFVIGYFMWSGPRTR